MFWSAKWNRKAEPNRRPKILYLADRNILVDDPKDKTFPPFGDARHKIENGEIVMSRDMYFGALAERLARELVNYSIPRSDIEAAKAADAGQDTKHTVALYRKANRLFTDLEKTGEGGELLLYPHLSQHYVKPGKSCEFPDICFQRTKATENLSFSLIACFYSLLSESCEMTFLLGFLLLERNLIRVNLLKNYVS